MARDEIDDLIRTARRARLAGDYAGAELACRQALDRSPVQPVASGLLGQCLAEQGDLKSAADLIDLALSLAPQDADVRLNAAALRDRQGDRQAAIAEARRACELAPDKFEAWATLGNLLGAEGDFKNAREALDRACAINPRHAGAALLLAGAAAETEDYATVARALDLAESVSPGLPQTYRLRAALARRGQDWPELARIAKNWMNADPADQEARIALAHALGQLGYYETASDVYQSVALANPKSAVHAAAMGRYRLGARRLDDAQEWFSRALDLDPACAEAHFGRARLLTYIGRLDEAETECRRAIAADARHAEAYGQLAEITGGDISDEDFVMLDAFAGEADLRPEQRSIAEFARGEALRRRGRHADAFEAWSAANRVKRDLAHRSPRGVYDPARQEAYVRRLSALFPHDRARPRPARTAKDQPTPIFIIGMPRSGTTLIESAISAHPRVKAGGELPGGPFFLDEFMAFAAKGDFAGGDLPERMKADWRRRYFEQVSEFSGAGRDFVTDKQPVNFMSLGLLREVFPEAPIIHIRRNPVETGFSIFRRNFSHQWPYANDLAAIGHYYGQYARIMAHWARAYRGAFLELRYEALASDFENEVRRALDYCDIGWDPGCLDFHLAERAVVTFSAVQVRKPVSREHLENAKPYAAQLEPLRRALRDAGVDPATGALFKP